MDKFMDGQSLTSKEYKYLALTSEVLNAHLDRKEYQTYVNLLTRDFISEVIFLIKF